MLNSKNTSLTIVLFFVMLDVKLKAAQIIAIDSLKYALEEINQRFISNSSQGILFDSQTLLKNIESQRGIIPEHEWSKLSADARLLAGHIFSSVGDKEEAVRFYFEASNFYKRNNDYLGYFFAVAYSLKFQFEEYNPDKYLRELDHYYSLCSASDSSFAKNGRIEYLVFRLSCLTEKMDVESTISELDSLFDQRLPVRGDLMRFKFYTEALIHAHRTQNTDLIERFYPKYSNEKQFLEIGPLTTELNESKFLFYSKKYESAEQKLNGILEQKPSPPLKIKVLRMLMEIGKIKNEYQLAFNHLEEIFNLEKVMDNTRRRILSDYYHQEAENHKLQEDILKAELRLSESDKKAQVYFIIFILSIFVIFIFVFRSQKLAIEAKLNSTLAEKKSMEIEYLINRQTIKSVIDKKKLEGSNGIGSSTDEYEELINSYDHRIVNALTQYNGITPRDIKIACFLASGMDNNDLANIFNLSPHSIRIAKSRLKKKLNIGKEVDLLAWLNGLKTPLD